MALVPICNTPIFQLRSGIISWGITPGITVTIIENDSKETFLNKTVIIHYLNQSLHNRGPNGSSEIHIKVYSLNDNKMDTLFIRKPIATPCQVMLQLPEIKHAKNVNTKVE